MVQITYKRHQRNTILFYLLFSVHIVVIIFLYKIKMIRFNTSLITMTILVVAIWVLPAISYNVEDARGMD